MAKGNACDKHACLARAGTERVRARAHKRNESTNACHAQTHTARKPTSCALPVMRVGASFSTCASTQG
eukprot:7740748-Prorocentrum_lima.AAC.1